MFVFSAWPSGGPGGLPPGLFQMTQTSINRTLPYNHIEPQEQAIRFYQFVACWRQFSALSRPQRFFLCLLLRHDTLFCKNDSLGRTPTIFDSVFNIRCILDTRYQVPGTTYQLLSTMALTYWVGHTRCQVHDVHIVHTLHTVHIVQHILCILYILYILYIPTVLKYIHTYVQTVHNVPAMHIQSAEVSCGLIRR